MDNISFEDMKILLWLFCIVFVAVLFCYKVVLKILTRLADKTENFIDSSMLKHCFSPILWLIILSSARIAWKILLLNKGLVELLNHLFSLSVILVVSWLIIRITNVLDDYLYIRFDITKKDNLAARKIHTQINVLKRIVIVIVCILALGTMLMTFEKVRQLGTTILASAGIMGIVIGMAAQKTIGTFIAGIQIAITQPIRIDDVVIVENEWGRIEEITLTYVVVKIWDLRRLIVPITYFIEKPFQNWTRVSADILGTVFIYTDYTVPFDEIRNEFKRLLENSDMWDKKVCVLQVTNANERTVEIRALLSAANASTAWSLRCYVREKMIEFIQEKYPEALPKTRAELCQADTEKEKSKNLTKAKK